MSGVETPQGTIRPMTAADWDAVEAIYRDGIATGDATFEREPPAWDRFDEMRLDVGRLVAVSPLDEVLGWVAASPVSARDVYRGVVEHSVYVAPRATGRGVGRRLLDALIAATEEAGIWTIQSSVFPENIPSLALHERAGFRRVGIRERIAVMPSGPRAGRWRDTVLIERRSPIVA
jgi:phosphinothricin acetyltransferase